MRRNLLVLAMTMVAFISCGGGALTIPGIDTESESELLAGAVEIAGLSGRSDVDIGSSFSYTFSRSIDTSTVTTGTFFLQEGSGACDAALAIAATISCSSSTVCTVDPVADLTAGTEYKVCLTAGSLAASLSKSFTGSGILYYDGIVWEPFEGDEISFTTAGAASEGEEEQGTLTYAEIFAGPCEDEGGGDTYSYAAILAWVQEEEDAACMAAVAQENGDVDCISINSVMEAISVCEIDVGDNKEPRLIDEAVFDLADTPDAVQGGLWPVRIFPKQNDSAQQYILAYGKNDPNWTLEQMLVWVQEAMEPDSEYTGFAYMEFDANEESCTMFDYNPMGGQITNCTCSFALAAAAGDVLAGSCDFGGIADTFRFEKHIE